MTKYTIWDNDVVAMHDSIAKEPAEFGLDEDITDEEAWKEAYAEVDRYLDDETANCDIQKKGEIFAIGHIQRWNGERAAYKGLNTHNIGDAFIKAIQSFESENSFELYVEGNKLFLSQLGHDNPTNPSIIELRECTGESLEDLIFEHGDSYDILQKYSKPLGKDVCSVYGWECEVA